MRIRSSILARRCALIVAAFILSSPLYAAVPFNVGDVFAGIGKGRFNHFSPTGTLLETLDDGQFTGFGQDATTGMCFDPAGNMYGTNLDKNSMSKFSNNGTLLAATFGSFNSGPESCLIVGGTTMYVSQVLGTGDIVKLNLSGTQLASYNTARSDWIDLAADQCTMFYSDEGPTIHRFNVCTNTALADFVTSAPGFFALRILPNGDVLAAAGSGGVKRFNSAGTLVNTYTAAGEDFFFALNLDPDGTHFWSGGINTGLIYKFNLTPVGPPILTFSSQAAASGGTILAGLAVFGERIVSNTAAPTIAKSFGSASIAQNGSTSLSFTLTNPNASGTLTGIGFTDTLPAGLVVSTPNGLTGTCGGGTITANASSAVISLTGATLAASATCTFSVNVTGITSGTKTNTTGAVTSVESGLGATASATITVAAPPPPSTIPTLQEWTLWLLGLLILIVTAGVTLGKHRR
jgi:hypothetical protein